MIWAPYPPCFGCARKDRVGSCPRELRLDRSARFDRKVEEEIQELETGHPRARSANRSRRRGRFAFAGRQSRTEINSMRKARCKGADKFVAVSVDCVELTASLAGKHSVMSTREIDEIWNNINQMTNNESPNCAIRDCCILKSHIVPLSRVQRFYVSTI